MRNIQPYSSMAFIAFFIILAYCYISPLEHIIYYQEHHHLFLFGRYYFDSVICSEGLVHYITSFIIQFFYHPVLGSCILSAMLTACFYFLAASAKRITGSHVLISAAALPPLYLFIKTMSPDYDLDMVTICTFISFIIYICCRLIKKRNRPSSYKTNMILPAIGIMVVGGLAFWQFYTRYNMGEHRMIMAQKHMDERNWDKVLEQTDNYLKRMTNNKLMFYFRNIALYHKGLLPQHLMDFPPHGGVTCLYFPWKSDSRESEYGHYLYEELGHINEAQRWETESMVVWGETAQHLTNLAKYNILNNKKEIAMFFINKLDQSLFYRRKAEELRKHLDTGKIPEMRNALLNVENTSGEYANVLNIGMELDYICEHDPTNRMAFEYLLCNLLLGNNVVRFVNSLKKYPQFYQKGENLPLLYQEALYLYVIGMGNEKSKESGYTISKNVISAFDEYYNLYKSGNINELKQKYGKSYWYYLHFISPYGNKIITN